MMTPVRGNSRGTLSQIQGPENLNIRIVLVDSQGVPIRTIRPQGLNPLIPGGHYARFLFEDLSDQNLKFNGSIVAIADGTDKFSIVALVQNQGLFDGGSCDTWESNSYQLAEWPNQRTFRIGRRGVSL